MGKRAVRTAPSGDGEGELGARLDLAVEVFEEGGEDVLGDVLDLLELDVGGRGGEGLAEVGLRGNEIDGLGPAVGGGVADFEGEVLIVGTEPVEVALRVVNHARFEVSAISGVAHEEGFLEDDASAAERVEDAAGGLFGGSEIDEDLSELGGEHADTSIAGGALLVTSSIGGNILDVRDDGRVAFGDE